MTYLLVASALILGFAAGFLVACVAVHRHYERLAPMVGNWPDVGPY